MPYSKEQKDELVTCYAALALYDAGHEITSQTIGEMITATNNEVEPYWPMLFGKLLGGDKIETLLTNLSAGSGGGGGGGASGGDAGDDAGKEEEKKEEKVEEEIDMGGAMDMFGGGGDGY